MEISLWNMWQADKAYAMGKNLDGVQQYVNAYTYLTQAVEANPGEPSYRDELAYNQAVLASAIYEQLKTSTLEGKMNLTIPQLEVSTTDLINSAITNSNQVVEISPNSLPFWKDRTKTLYQLSLIDPKYNAMALEAIKKAADLAPTDAKVHYNLGLLLAKNGQTDEAIKVFEETLKLKPDYTDAKNSLEMYVKKP